MNLIRNLPFILYWLIQLSIWIKLKNLMYTTYLRIFHNIYPSDGRMHGQKENHVQIGRLVNKPISFQLSFLIFLLLWKWLCYNINNPISFLNLHFLNEDWNCRESKVNHVVAVWNIGIILGCNTNYKRQTIGIGMQDEQFQF